MSAGPFAIRHPLDGAVSASPARNANHVAILPDPMVISIAALPGEEAAAAETLAGFPPESLRFVGPGEWLLVEPAQDSALLASVRAALGRRALVTEQGSGRAVLHLSGPDSRAILAKLVPLDLDREVFAIGQSANCFFAHVSANLARIGEDEFEISLMRSFALFAFEELMEMGLEFGLTAGFAT